MERTGTLAVCTAINYSLKFDPINSVIARSMGSGQTDRRVDTTGYTFCKRTINRH